MRRLQRWLAGWPAAYRAALADTRAGSVVPTLRDYPVRRSH